MAKATVTILDEDYQRLLMAAEADDMIVTCETCGAWMDRDDPRCASLDDFTGCWFAATGSDADRSTCVRYLRPARPDRRL